MKGTVSTPRNHKKKTSQQHKQHVAAGKKGTSKAAIGKIKISATMTGAAPPKVRTRTPRPPKPPITPVAADPSQSQTTKKLAQPVVLFLIPGLPGLIITWEPVHEATSYEIGVEENSGNIQPLETTAGNIFRIKENFIVHGARKFSVRAKNPLQVSDWSKPIEVGRPTAQLPIEVVEATVSKMEAVRSWWKGVKESLSTASVSRCLQFSLFLVAVVGLFCWLNYPYIHNWWLTQSSTSALPSPPVSPSTNTNPPSTSAKVSAPAAPAGIDLKVNIRPQVFPTVNVNSDGDTVARKQACSRGELSDAEYDAAKTQADVPSAEVIDKLQQGAPAVDETCTIPAHTAYTFPNIPGGIYDITPFGNIGKHVRLYYNRTSVEEVARQIQNNERVPNIDFHTFCNDEDFPVTVGFRVAIKK